MINDTIIKLLKSFPNSFINHNVEFIAHYEANEYFGLLSCENELEIKCKVLECLSRSTFKAHPFKSNKKNKEFNEFMLNGINRFLETNFNQGEMEIIYQELGNGVNRMLTIGFIKTNYNLNIFRR